MIINNNISSLTATNALAKTETAMNKSIQKLSSGLRINKAADDAAGLAVSEKMRSQIRGLEVAKRNIVIDYHFLFSSKILKLLYILLYSIAFKVNIF